MDLLIDYDNVLDADRRLGLALLLEKIMARLDAAQVPLGRKVHARLYGGWYDGNILSRKAQFLAAELARDFPRLFRLPSSLASVAGTGGQPPSAAAAVAVTTELALSLDIDPSSHFHHTFRRQTPPIDVRCHDPRALGCSEANCPALTLHETL